MVKNPNPTVKPTGTPSIPQDGMWLPSGYRGERGMSENQSQCWTTHYPAFKIAEA